MCKYLTDICLLLIRLSLVCSTIALCKVAPGPVQATQLGKVSRLGQNSTVSESSFRTCACEIAGTLYSIKLAYSTWVFRLYPCCVTPRGAPVKWQDQPRPIGSSPVDSVAAGERRLESGHVPMTAVDRFPSQLPRPSRGP